MRHSIPRNSFLFMYVFNGTRARGYKTFFMLNTGEQEFLNAHKYKDIKNWLNFGSDKPRMLFVPPLNAKMPTIVDILTFMSRKKFMLS